MKAQAGTSAVSNKTWAVGVPGPKPALRRRVWQAQHNQPCTVSHVWHQQQHSNAARSLVPARCHGATSATHIVQSEYTRLDDFQNDKRPVILYDGVCNMCNGFVNMMLDLDPQGKFRMAALQSPAGMRLLERCGRSREDNSSIVLVEERTHYTKSDAVLNIAKRLDNGLPLLAFVGNPVPALFRDFLYDQVANNRYSFMGKRDVCRVSQAGFEGRFLVE